MVILTSFNLTLGVCQILMVLPSLSKLEPKKKKKTRNKKNPNATKQIRTGACLKHPITMHYNETL